MSYGKAHTRNCDSKGIALQHIAIRTIKCLEVCAVFTLILLFASPPLYISLSLPPRFSIYYPSRSSRSSFWKRLSILVDVKRYQSKNSYSASLADVVRIFAVRPYLTIRIYIILPSNLLSRTLLLFAEIYRHSEKNPPIHFSLLCGITMDLLSFLKRKDIN